MDDAAALQFLDEFLGFLNESRAIRDSNPDGYFMHPRWPPLQEGINSMLLGVRRMARTVEPDLVGELVSNDQMYHWQWTEARDATHKLRGAIEQRERVEAMLAPVGPKLSASKLHPWVWDAAAHLWDDGHYRAAVQAAASSVDAQLQAKLGRYDISGTDLVTQSFRLDEPKPRDPRLRFDGLVEGSPPYKSAHEGAMSFGRGCMMAIRNPASHDSTELDEQVALERLAALSVLARWIDEAVVDKA